MLDQTVEPIPRCSRLASQVPRLGEQEISHGDSRACSQAGTKPPSGVHSAAFLGQGEEMPGSVKSVPVTTAKRRPEVGPTRSIHQLKVTLRHTSPPVWRRLQVPSRVFLGELHFILQTAMGWDDSHLHLFSVGGAEYADGRVHDPWGGPSPKNENRARLGRVAPLGTHLRYEYDFGDGWEHELIVEKVFPAEPDVTYPRCVSGRRACPPEDCGGPPGYANLLEALTDSAHPRHTELADWFGDGFDPEAFDPEAVNAWLA